jgi:hypothetical protein
MSIRVQCVGLRQTYKEKRRDADCVRAYIEGTQHVKRISINLCLVLFLYARTFAMVVFMLAHTSLLLPPLFSLQVTHAHHKQFRFTCTAPATHAHGRAYRLGRHRQLSPPRAPLFLFGSVQRS